MPIYNFEAISVLPKQPNKYITSYGSDTIENAIKAFSEKMVSGHHYGRYLALRSDKSESQEFSITPEAANAKPIVVKVRDTYKVYDPITGVRSELQMESTVEKELPEPQESDDEGLRTVPAGNGLEGYVWHHYGDGSGSLHDADGKSVFEYDRMPYHAAGWTEYRDETSANPRWDVWQDSFKDFIAFAERKVSNYVASH